MAISTSLEEAYVERINRLVEKDVTSQAAILRKCVVRYLPELEREILGEDFAGKPPAGNGHGHGPAGGPKQEEAA